jgi:hypothetical protein
MWRICNFKNVSIRKLSRQRPLTCKWQMGKSTSVLTLSCDFSNDCDTEQRLFERGWHTNVRQNRGGREFARLVPFFRESDTGKSRFGSIEFFWVAQKSPWDVRNAFVKNKKERYSEKWYQRETSIESFKCQSFCFGRFWKKIIKAVKFLC